MHGFTRSAMLSMVMIISLATAIPAPSSHLAKRVVKYVTDSESLTEVTYMTTSDYFRDAMKLNECFTNFSRPANTEFMAITTPDHEVAINYYLDTECTEFEFSIVSEYNNYTGEFASAKVLTEDPDGANHDGPVGQPKDTKPQQQQGNTSTTTGAGTTGTGSVGFIIGAGLVSILTIAGIVALGVFLYRKHQNGGRGDAKFMTLATGRDDYDDEVGLTGENGPHSSALMQSRVGVSFDDERFPAKYQDEDQADSDDEDDDR
ncbi:hypothetical protein BGZ81_002186, partial [Podila clonocystis]